MTGNKSFVFRFADVEVREREFCLVRRGEVLRVEPKAFRVLLFLLHNPHKLIPKDELLNAVWGHTAVSENSLARSIGLLRRLLGDDLHSPRYIETVATIGYRLVCKVEISEDGSGDTQATDMANGLCEGDPQPTDTANGLSESKSVETPAKAANPLAQIRKLAMTSGLAVTLVAAAAWGWGRWRARATQVQSVPHITSVAVLPLANLSGDSSQDYLADGMTDELTTDLARINSLRVISETSAKRYRGTHRSLQEIANELDVDAVVEGSVARSGDRVRITAQLVDTKKDQHLWAQSYERQAGDILALQRDLSKAIASQVHLTLTPTEQRHLEVLPTRDPAAYDAYLRARYRANTALAVEADADATIAEGEQAVMLDRDFAEAYVVLARGCSAKIFAWAGGKDFDEKAFVALRKALDLDPTLAEAYAARGALYYTRLHGFDIAASVGDYRLAISLNPNLAEAHQSLGAELTHAGLHERAIEEFRATLRLDPQNDGAKYRLSRALWQSQRFAEALQNYDRYTIESFEKALTLAYLGHRAQSWETIERVASQLAEARSGGHRGGDQEDVAAVRAFLYAIEGQPQRAEQQIKAAVRFGKNNDHFHHAEFILAAACAEMGKPHEAVTWLRRVAERGMPNYPLFHDNPSMTKLRGNAEYDQFMGELILRWDQLNSVMGMPGPKV